MRELARMITSAARTLPALCAFALVAVGGPAAAQLEVADRYPDWSPDGSRIVFESTRDGNAEIYVLAVDGGEPVRLTHSTAFDRVPSFSPDGRRIVFQSTRHSNAFRGPLTYQIYVMDADGDSVRRLTHNTANDTLPRFSPDGGRILFVSDRTGAPEVHVMAADGSEQSSLTVGPRFREVLAPGEERSNPHWSANGRAILFDTKDAATGLWHVFQLELETGELENLSAGIEGPSGEGAFFASASPDGHTIGMSFDHDPEGNGNWEIWLLDTASGRSRQLTSWRGNDFWQAFSPDGSEIAFSSSRDGSYALYRMSVAGGEPVKLTQRDRP